MVIYVAVFVPMCNCLPFCFGFVPSCGLCCRAVCCLTICSFADNVPGFMLRRDGQGCGCFFPFDIRLFQVFSEFGQFAVQGK